MDFSVLSSLAGNDGKTICPAVVGKKIIYIYIYILYMYMNPLLLTGSKI